MSDDLVKRLRDLGDHASFEPHMHHTAADRIEELEAQHKKTYKALLSVTRLHDEVEAKLAKAVETLEFYGDERNYEGEYIADPCGCCGSWYEPKIHKDGQDSGDYARTTLAELTGGKDE